MLIVFALCLFEIIEGFLLSFFFNFYIYIYSSCCKKLVVRSGSIKHIIINSQLKIVSKVLVQVLLIVRFTIVFHIGGKCINKYTLL